MEGSDDGARDLAAQIRLELADPAPQGFAFNDHAIRQDAALDRLVDRLHHHPDGGEVEAAVRRAVAEERDGWTLLKLLELVERLSLASAVEPLLRLAASPPQDERGRFLAGRACEVMLTLPLDLAMRNRVNEVSRGPLDDIARFRMGAERAQRMHRPRQVEWTLLAALMALAGAGLVVAWLALGR
jgi:hypothetical protein